MFDFQGRTLSEARARHYLDQGVWSQESFVDVLKRDVELYPDFAHKDEERTLTYRELWSEVESFAANLYRMGLRKGDTIGLQMPNTLDYVVALFGAARIGVIGVSLQIDLGRDALLQSLKQSQAKAWVITSHFRGQSLYEMALELQKELPQMQQVILQGNSPALPQDAVLFSTLRSTGESLPADVIAANQPGPLDAYLMVFTSGTTGSPKGVVYLHANYLWSARAYAKNFGYEPGQAILDLAPISHQTGMLAGVMMTIATGGRIHLLDRFSAGRVLKWIEAEHPSYLVGAPPHVIHVANAPGLTSSDTSSVKLFIYAGAPAPSVILQKLQREGGIKVGCMFGWSEGFVLAATRPDDPLDAISSTVGHQIPGTEIRLVDEEGHEVRQGDAGEMWSRGPNFCAGYYENPVAAKRQFDEDGWFHSGDLLRQDAHGRYVFVARADDIINRGGTKIDPKSVEDVIAAHEAVERVAVVGAPHETLGQQSVACIVLKEGASAFTLAELRTFLGERELAKFQFPDRIDIMKELPMTHSGKIKNRELRERYLQEGA